MGKVSTYLRELVPIIARTHPAFRSPPSPRRRPPGGNDAVRELRSEVHDLREEVRRLAGEVARQQRGHAG